MARFYFLRYVQYIHINYINDRYPVFLYLGLYSYIELKMLITFHFPYYVPKCYNNSFIIDEVISAFSVSTQKNCEQSPDVKMLRLKISLTKLF